jgi:hypothetical protein
MRWGTRRAAASAAALLLASVAGAQGDLAARVKKAEDAARANAATPQGKQWRQSNGAMAGRLMIPVLNRCLPEEPGDIPTVFSVFVRLSAKGRAREVVTELDEKVGTCMTQAARDVPFPEAPREDYWIQVNMAAPL